MSHPKDHLFMDIAKRFAQESTCERGHVGCVIVRDNRIISTGYNGAPAGQDHCTDEGCDIYLGVEAGCQRAVHAEANAIAYAARAGVSLEDSTMYCTHGPCLKCAQLIVSSGISTSVYDRPYRDLKGIDLLVDSSVVVVIHAR